MTIISSTVLQREPGVTALLAPYGPRGPIIAGTSITPVNIATGPVTFDMTEYGLGFAPGVRVRATAGEAPTNQWVEGVVTRYEGIELDVTLDLASGGGVYNEWEITVAGQPGLAGPQGPKGDTGDVPEAPEDHVRYARLDGGWANLDVVFAGKADIGSPIFQGNPQRQLVLAPTTNDQSLATAAFVKANITTATAGFQPSDADLTSLAAAAAFGGGPTNSGLYYRKAAGSWVALNMGNGITLDATSNTLNVTAGGGNISNSGTPVVNDLAQWVSSNTIKSIPLATLFANPAFTGIPTAPNPAAADSSAQIATTNWVKLQGYVTGSFLPTTGGTITGNLAVTGTLGVTGAVTFSTTLTVNSGAFFNASALVTGNLGVSGEIRSTGSRLIAQGPAIPSVTCYNTATGGVISLALNNNNQIILGPSDAAGGSVSTWFTLDSGNLFCVAQGYKPGGGIWADSSDRRIKTVVGDFSAGLETIQQLNPVRYTHKGNYSTALNEPSPHYLSAAAGTEFVGFVAQDVERSFPELVTQVEAFLDGEKVDDLRMVDTTPLIYALVNAVKELAARVEQLESAAE